MQYDMGDKQGLPSVDIVFVSKVNCKNDRMMNNGSMELAGWADKNSKYAQRQWYASIRHDGTPKAGWTGISSAGCE